MNINNNFYNILLLIGSLLLSIQMVPQILHIYKNKSAKDFSYGTIIIVLFGLSTIFIYGLHINTFELWFPPLLQIFFMIIVLNMKIYYQKKKKINENNIILDDIIVIGK